MNIKLTAFFFLGVSLLFGVYFLYFNKSDQEVAKLKEGLQTNILNENFASAQQLVQAKKCHEALPLLSSLIEQEPKHIRALELMAKCYVRMDQIDDAITSLQLAIEIHPLPRLVRRLDYLKMKQQNN